MGGPKGRSQRAGEPQAEAQRRTGAKGLFASVSDREEPAPTPRGTPRGVGAGGEISRRAMVSTGSRPSQVMRPRSRERLGATLEETASATCHGWPARERQRGPIKPHTARIGHWVPCPPRKRCSLVRFFRQSTRAPPLWKPRLARRRRAIGRTAVDRDNAGRSRRNIWPPSCRLCRGTSPLRARHPT